MKKSESIKFRSHDKNKHSGFFAACLVLGASLLLTACSKGGNLDKDTTSAKGSVSPATPKREWVYVPEVLPVDTKQYVDYEKMQLAGDAFCYVSRAGDAANSAKSICRYSLSGGEFKSVPIHWPEGGNDWDTGYYFFAQDGGLYMTPYVYPSSGSTKQFLCRMDSEGNCLFSKDVTEKTRKNAYLRRVDADSQGRLYLALDNGEILLYTNEGDYHGSVRYASPEEQVPLQIKGACEGADGRFYVCIGQGSMNITGGNMEGTESVSCTLMEIDFENARLVEAAGNLPNINGLCGGGRRGSDSGTGSDDSGSQYDLLLYDDRAVYGYRFNAGNNSQGSLGEELFAWMDSDINGYCVTSLYLLGDGRLCATVVDWMNDDRVIVTLRRTKSEQAPQREELVLATVDGGSNLATMAVKFNRGNSRYRVTVKNYESLTDLYNAILAKEPMDLIDLSGLKVEKLADRGLFEDLAPYVEQSQVFDRSDFVEGILDVYTCGNTLVGIPAEFMIRTVVGDGAKLHNKTGLTLEELYSLADRHPGVKAFDGVTKEEMMQYLMIFNEDAFIDWENGDCRFDSEEFKKMLAYVGRFPDSAAGGGGEESLSDKIKKGEVLFTIEDLYPMLFWDYRKMFGEDAACIGFPTAEGKGGHLLFSSDGYAIAAVSEHKESAWAFIEEVLTRERGRIYDEFFISYPTLKKVLNERVEAAIGRNEATWDDVNAVLKLLPDATPFFSVEDDEIIKIISEEAPAYYAGQKKAEDVMAIIQNRVKLYVAENR